MPDDLPRKAPDYDDDFYAWTQHQASVLREMPVTDNRFDREHVAEEIEDLGRSYRDAVRSQVRRIIEHFLKLEFSPAQDPRYGWMRSIASARAEMSDKITRTIRREVERELERLYRQAKEQAELGFREHGESGAVERLPNACPYTLGQILQKRWYPDPVEKQP
jgi:uncharacterized protein DUF29